MQLFEKKGVTQPLISSPVVSSEEATSVIPALSEQQMQQVYRMMVDEYRVGQLVLLENTGRALLALTRRQLGGRLAGQPVTVLAGAGNCGAAGMVTARYLANAGAQVVVILARPVEALGPAAAHQYQLLLRLEVPVFSHNTLPVTRLAGTLRQTNLVLDALMGGGLHGWPTGNEASLIRIVRQVGLSVLSLDLPSGLPPDGEPPNNPDLILKAQATLALALPRLAHIQNHALEMQGQLYLADIGVPPRLYSRLNLTVGPLFSASDIILLRRPPATPALG